MMDHYMVCFLCIYACATLAQAIQAFKAIPLKTFMVQQNSWVYKTKPKQLPTSPTNSLKAVTKNDLSQLGYFQEVGGQLPCNS